MKQLSRRQKIMGGLFLLVTCAWTGDMLTGGPAAATAKDAAAAAAATDVESAVPPDPADLAEIIRRLSARATMTRPHLPLQHLRRDPFAMTEVFLSAAADSREGRPENSQAENAVPEDSSFASLHKLEGITSGRVPLALIDGRLYRIGAIIGDYRLIEIATDHVVVSHGAETEILSLATESLD